MVRVRVGFMMMVRVRISVMVNIRVRVKVRVRPYGIAYLRDNCVQGYSAIANPQNIANTRGH